MVDDERFWQEIRDLRAEVFRLRDLVTQNSERLRVVEIARENAQMRNSTLPGWLIAATGVLVSLLGVLVTLFLAGRLP